MEPFSRALLQDLKPHQYYQSYDQEVPYFTCSMEAVGFIQVPHTSTGSDIYFQLADGDMPQK